jgi:bis(5'-nucleosyl)-tetraphosphatase (symmetrical)
MSTYAIGDIQGCFDALTRLLDFLGFNRSRDRLWFVGDLVNRGSQSLETLRFVRDLGESAVTVLGNHDLHLLMRSEGFGKASREDTLDAVLAAEDRHQLISWLRGLPLFHVEGGYAMVHAGLLPQWPVAQAADLSAEVMAALTAPDYSDFLAHMWGSDPAAWHDDLTGWDRLRVVVNAMTRLRFCTPEGAMEFRAAGAKGPPERGPAGCVPWYAAPNRRSAEQTLVTGHWSALGFRQQPNLLALDSGCLWGGRLTAVRLEDRRVFQLPCPRQVEPNGWE